MRDFSANDGVNEGQVPAGVSAASALRSVILEKITPILSECNQIDDSGQRLVIQACCLDVVTALEDIIGAFGLEEHLRQPTEL